MKALHLDARPMRFLMAKGAAAIGGKRAYFSGPFRTVDLTEIPEPALPSPDWVKVRTRYCGVCGSDINMMLLKESPSAEPFVSFPCVLGHEFVGDIIETGENVTGFGNGDRVAVNPFFGCAAREIAPLCDACTSGRVCNCRNHAEGRFSPGMFLGTTRDLNGGFAPIVAVHQSQLFHIPDGLGLRAAVMTEPVSVALQSVFDNRPGNGEKVLVIGAGVIGNLVVQSLRAVSPACHISVMDPSAAAAKLAIDCGADQAISPGDSYRQSAETTGARLYKPTLGGALLRGGFDRIYDTVGNSGTVKMSLAALGMGGTLSLVGISKKLCIDPTPLWLELQTVRGVYGYGEVDWEGARRHVFEIAMELMTDGAIEAEKLITHEFTLDDYRRMLEVNLNKGKYKAVKTIFTF